MLDITKQLNDSNLLRESDTLELKSSFSADVIETLVAFANTKGGSVVIGVDDSGAPASGFSITKESVVNWVNEIKTKTQLVLVPDVEICEINGQPIVWLSISEYPVKPVACRGRYYKRVGNSNHQMTLNEIANLHLQTINMSWDFYADVRHSIDDISLDKVNRFIKQVNLIRSSEINDDPLTVLRKYELLRDGNITFGCFILFCNQESLISTIEAGRFDSETIIRDSVSIKDDLFSEVDACITFIQKHISKRYIITGKPQRDEVWEYPLNAVREIVVNMIVHRDYQAAADSTIKIHNDRIEFFNPGALPDGITIESILSGRIPSNSRNKLIASIFREAGVIEKYGSGIKRVRHILANAEAKPPVFEELPGFFKVTLFPIRNQTDVTENVTENVTGPSFLKRKAVILAKIEENRLVSIDQLAEILGVSRRTVLRDMNKLKEKGVIKRVGPDKGGCWVLCNG